MALYFEKGMSWILVAITITGLDINVFGSGVYESYEACLVEKEELMKEAPQPKINYEMICVMSNQPKIHGLSL